MTVKAKAIVTAFTATVRSLLHWNGCSTGGRQGLAEAQRYPDDFDGIIAGAQANPRTRLGAWHLTIGTAVLKDPAAFIPPGKYPAIHRAVLAACDAAGRCEGRPRSTIRHAVSFDPAVLTCKGPATPDAPDCLTPRQVEAREDCHEPGEDRSRRRDLSRLRARQRARMGALLAGPEPTAITRSTTTST